MKTVLFISSPCRVSYTCCFWIQGCDEVVKGRVALVETEKRKLRTPEATARKGKSRHVPYNHPMSCIARWHIPSHKLGGQPYNSSLLSFLRICRMIPEFEDSEEPSLSLLMEGPGKNCETADVHWVTLLVEGRTLRRVDLGMPVFNTDWDRVPRSTNMLMMQLTCRSSPSWTRKCSSSW